MTQYIPNGYVKATATYQCKWCCRQETIIFGGEEVNLGQLDGWREYGPHMRSGYDLCSSDCEKERDEALNQAYANLDPLPGHSHQHPAGLKAEIERLRLLKMKERSESL